MTRCERVAVLLCSARIVCFGERLLQAESICASAVQQAIVVASTAPAIGAAAALRPAAIVASGGVLIASVCAVACAQWRHCGYFPALHVATHRARPALHIRRVPALFSFCY